jgi:hypothetical protein
MTQNLVAGLPSGDMRTNRELGRQGMAKPKPVDEPYALESQ